MESLLKSTQNTRDLGGYLCADGMETAKMVLLRSDAPKQLLQKYDHTPTGAYGNIPASVSGKISECR